MWEAHLLCSSRGCTEEIYVAVDSLDELEGLSCECGYGVVLLSVSELERV